MKYEKLERIYQLFKEGALSEEEYQKEKERILNEKEEYTFNEFASKVKQTASDTSNSTYLGVINFVLCIPKVGWIISIIIWAFLKDKDRDIDQQGKNIMNFLISYFIYYWIIVLLGFIIPGTFGITGILNAVTSSPLGFANIIGGGVFVTIVGIVIGYLLPIFGGIQGLNGKTWHYPLSFKFIK